MGDERSTTAISAAGVRRIQMPMSVYQNGCAALEGSDPGAEQLSDSPTQDLSEDVSPRALRVARALDRLPAGRTYTLAVEKPLPTREPWQVHITISESIQFLTLEKKPT